LEAFESGRIEPLMPLPSQKSKNNNKYRGISVRILCKNSKKSSSDFSMAIAIFIGI